ncbi:SAM-dependent methyltransferase [Kibdelosporangium banguiense]|uniref:SAM-dependent methyltransferase n=1 Tax=Kibdelosporangium banguiense TaxID=1365924 RepID=A0ABS4T6N2_9PSEU|nr:class I SAM-dependent methyltransferase [Kibdelosporangium banguiense]MBP2320053.1 SAM-dependent methyltransferase [Kibdelosporangium banguiense]
MDDVLAHTRNVLSLYDMSVFHAAMPVVWRCPVKHVQGLYDASVGAQHLEMGVATGHLLANAGFPVRDPQITLLDLNPAPLAYTAQRLARYDVTQVRANVLEPLPLDDLYDSVSLNFLLHCVPGSIKEKGSVLKNAAAVVRPGGIVFGSTILSAGVAVAPQARLLMKYLNARGIFHNDRDTLDDLREVLAGLGRYQLVVRGSVALFRARLEP